MHNSTRIHDPAVAALLASALLAAAQAAGAEGGLAQQLATITDVSGIVVTQAGTIPVVKKEGIQANPPKLGYFVSRFAAATDLGPVQRASAANCASAGAKTQADRYL